MLFKKKAKDDYVSTNEFGKLIKFNTNEKTFNVKGKVYGFDIIEDVDLIIDGHSVTKGGLGKMVAGGLLLGPVGALVGGVTAKKKNKEVVDMMKIVVKTNDFDNPTIELKLIETAFKKQGTIYKMIENTANQLMAIFEQIIRSK